MANEHSELFQEEARDLLEELETSLLELEKNKTDDGLVKKIFRALHTIKGSGAMFGFDEISEFTHQVENAFDMVRNGKIPVTRELVDIGLSSIDIIKMMFNPNEGNEELQNRKSIIIENIEKLKPSPTHNDNQEKLIQTLPIISEEDGKEITYRIRFKPESDFEEKGGDLLLLFNELHKLGTCRTVAHVMNIPVVEEIETDRCYMSWDILLTTSKSKNAIRDIFIFVEDYAQISIDIIDDGNSPHDEADYKKLGYIMVERGDLSIEDMKDILASKKFFGEMLIERGIVNVDKVESALVEQEHVRELRKKRQNEEILSTLRVPAEKADKLVNLVGELVTMQARLSQVANECDDPELISIAEEAERLIWDLRDNAMSIRMIQISTTFSRFTRLVRDLSEELQKKVELVTEGGETELDKTVIERLTDPLLHIIRNCIDHGIELPKERENLKKNPVGTIRLSAAYSGAKVIIVVEDDGAGIDIDAVKTRAIDRGLLKPGAEISENQLYNILFEPGFSTAKELTSISGRGVGMDIIKKNIEALRGTVTIKSRKGSGTRITLQIPLTLAIIDGLMIQVGKENYIIPLSAVEEIVELTREDREKTHGRDIITIRGRIVPYIDLRDYFLFKGEKPFIQQIVVVEVENKKVGIVVDEVIGKHQTVIKSLGKVYRDADGISGATILGDGTVALILDVTRIALSTESQSESN